jgi:hypothetical protein
MVLLQTFHLLATCGVARKRLFLKQKEQDTTERQAFPWFAGPA